MPVIETLVPIKLGFHSWFISFVVPLQSTYAQRHSVVLTVFTQQKIFWPPSLKSGGKSTSFPAYTGVPLKQSPASALIEGQSETKTSRSFKPAGVAVVVTQDVTPSAIEVTAPTTELAEENQGMARTKPHTFG